MKLCRAIRVAVYAFAFLAGVSLYPVLHRDALRQSSTAIAATAPNADCRGEGHSYVRTTLYFGTKQPSGLVSEREWRQFLRGEVTPRFPEGLTVLEGFGQWRGEDGRVGRERSKVLLILHDGTGASAAALKQISESYKRKFRQESILAETARVCAAF